MKASSHNFVMFKKKKNSAIRVWTCGHSRQGQSTSVNVIQNIVFKVGAFDKTWIHWILCVESIHGRSIKLENQVESIQRPGYESRVNLHHDAEPRAKVVLQGVAILFL